MTKTYALVSSPIGQLLVIAEGQGLESIQLPRTEGQHKIDGSWTRGGTLVDEAARQLGEYFGGTRQAFDLPLAAQGTPFMQAVWKALAEIPYGQTTSYGALAKRIGKPTAARAIGSANGKNPLPIVVPCHRVIGADGSLTGFAGGLGAKQALLELEGVCSAEAQRG